MGLGTSHFLMQRGRQLSQLLSVLIQRGDGVKEAKTEMRDREIINERIRMRDREKERESVCVCV